MGSWFLNWGLNPRPQYWKHEVLTTEPKQKSQHVLTLKGKRNRPNLLKTVMHYSLLVDYCILLSDTAIYYHIIIKLILIIM